MMVKIMSNSKRIEEKAHFYVSRLAGAVQIGILMISSSISHFNKKPISTMAKNPQCPYIII